MFDNVIYFHILFSYSWQFVLYWSIAFAASIVWGCYAIWYEVIQYSEYEVIIEIEENLGKTTTTTTQTKTEYAKNLMESYHKLGKLGSIGAFLSDFLLSLIGWCSLYVLMAHIECSKTGNIDIFLGTVAVICISGYGFKISEKINQFSK